VRRRLGSRSLAILAYHKIGEPPPGGWQTWFYVPEENFVGHLRLAFEHRRLVETMIITSEKSEGNDH
jgi:hypothetical protein